MVETINSGVCIDCGVPLTNIVDGMTRPFCRDCQEKLEALIKKGSIGKKYKNGKMQFPPAPKGD